MTRRIGIIGTEGLAGLALLAASEAMNRGERLAPLPTVEKIKPKAKSASLQRLLRKAKP